MGYSYNAGLYCVIGSLPGSDLAVPEWKVEYADDFGDVTPPPGEFFRVGGLPSMILTGTEKWKYLPVTGRTFLLPVFMKMRAQTPMSSNIPILRKHSSSPPPFMGAFANPIFHDFDGDGYGELVISDIHGHIFVITHETSNNFEDFGPDAWTYVMNWPTVQNNSFMRSGFMGDVDQYGKPDIYYNDFRSVSISMQRWVSMTRASRRLKSKMAVRTSGASSCAITNCR